MIRRRKDLKPYEVLGCMVRINHDSNYMREMIVEHLVQHHLTAISKDNYLLWTKDNKPHAYVTWITEPETRVYHMAAPYGDVLKLCRDLKDYLNREKNIYNVRFIRRDKNGTVRKNGFINTRKQ
jgi:hemolysin-activating ACP:hemolysin acyltransferase